MENKTISQMFYNTVSKHADKNLYHHKVDGNWVGIKGFEIKSTVEKIIKGLRFSEREVNDFGLDGAVSPGHTLSLWWLTAPLIRKSLQYTLDVSND